MCHRIVETLALLHDVLKFSISDHILSIGVIIRVNMLSSSVVSFHINISTLTQPLYSHVVFGLACLTHMHVS